MWPYKEGYNFIAVNFGGYHMAKTLEEAKAVAAKMQGDTPTIYTRGFFSDNCQRVIGTDRWWPLERSYPNDPPSQSNP